MPDTITIDLGDGDEATMITELLHATQRRVEEILRPCLIFSEIKLKVGAEGEAVKGNSKDAEIQIDMSKVDQVAIDEARILGQVLCWKFNSKALEVNQPTLDLLPEKKYQILKDKVDELFGGSSPLAESGTGS